MEKNNNICKSREFEQFQEHNCNEDGHLWKVDSYDWIGEELEVLCFCELCGCKAVVEGIPEELED